jgi:hypothetical protein
MFRFIWLIVSLSIAIPSLAFSTFSSSALSSEDNSTVLQQAQKALEANQNQPASTDSSQAASKVIRGTGSMASYENSDYGISIKFPNNWKPSEVNLDAYVIVVFNAPEKNPIAADYVFDPAWLLVGSQKLPSSNTTLPQFIKSFFKDTLFLNSTDYRIISNSSHILGGLEAEKIIMYEYIGGTSKVMRIMAVDHTTGTGYWIKYSAHPGLFSNYLPGVNQMVDSFKLVNKP